MRPGSHFIPLLSETLKFLNIVWFMAPSTNLFQMGSCKSYSYSYPSEFLFVLVLVLRVLCASNSTCKQEVSVVCTNVALRRQGPYFLRYKKP